MFRYPKPLKKGDTIGIVAPSSGVTGVFSKKLDYAVNNLIDLGYQVILGKHVKNQKKLTSAPSIERANAFEEMYLDGRITAIIPPWGGEFLMDMLPYLDFKKLEKVPPKWVMGFSDISTLLFVLTLKINIATAHGPNLLDFGNESIDPSVLEALEILGKREKSSVVQYSLERYQSDWLEVTENSFPPYDLKEKVYWKVLNDVNEVHIEGRLIGGNLDVLCKLIGTSYDRVQEFIENNKSDGILWYFESCEMNSTDLYRTLWQMQMNGWFENCNGIVFGRLEGYKKIGDFSLEDAYKKVFNTLDIPVIYNIDIGHLPPQLVFINGAFCKIIVKNGKGKVVQKLI